MLILKAVIAVLINLIIYYSFGTLFVCRDDKHKSVLLSVGVGFFAYYSLFCLFVYPIMFTYRTLTLLTGIWCCFTLVVVALALVLRRETVALEMRNIKEEISKSPAAAVIIAALILVQVIVIVRSYDFTLDAAYYVANVTTSLDTDMINIYDPFTGAWQDHFELRYAFATYSINDAVMCRLFGLPALVGCKTVMASTVAIVSNLMYLAVSRELFSGDSKKSAAMLGIITWVNFTFITLYTASNFLVKRTYEGKAVVGNVTVVAIFLMFIILISEKAPKLFWLELFLISFGSATVSSSANMLVPAQLSVLLVPYIIKKKKWAIVPKYLIMLIPGICMMLIYVLYVKGFFAIHTYYRR